MLIALESLKCDQQMIFQYFPDFFFIGFEFLIQIRKFL